MRSGSPFQRAHFGEPISGNPRPEVGLAQSNLYVPFLCIPIFCHLADLLIFDLAVAQITTMAQWTAHPDCPAHVKAGLEARVRSLPPSYLLAPITGEVFENVQLCRERLQGWALSQGFAIVQTRGGEGEAKPRFHFYCIHHAEDTKNNRQLEKHVERNEQDDITTRRK
jgi:hypothetical protein